MNPLQKKRVITTLKYTWPIYLISALIIGLALGFIFNVTHRAPGYTNLTFFISGRMDDDKKLRDDILEKYSDKGMETISYIDVDPNDSIYYSKLTVSGYGSADIFIIHASYLTNFKISSGAIELDEELINSFYQGYTLYKEGSISYGVKINKDKVKDYMTLPNEDCYMFLNAKSENIGEYSQKKDKEHDVALHILKDWGM